METTLNPHVAAFVTHLLNAGGVISRLTEGLIEALIESGWSHADATDEIIGSLAGTINARFASLPATDLERAAELLDLALQAVMSDMGQAISKSHRQMRRHRRRR